MEVLTLVLIGTNIISLVGCLYCLETIRGLNSKIDYLRKSYLLAKRRALYAELLNTTKSLTAKGE
jgi:hypothetical protein